MAPAERLSVARQLADISLISLMHTALTPVQMAAYARAHRSVVCLTAGNRVFRMRTLLVMPVLFGPSAAGLWLGWPWLSPHFLPSFPSGADSVVILDGGEARLAAGDRIAARLPQPPQRLLIRCPRTAPPLQPLPELLQGFDTATQISALDQWLRRQPPVGPVWIATDPVHMARSVLLARIALAPQGIRVAPVHPPAPSPRERPKLLRDALRLMVRRLTGSTGAWLAPERLARKREDCGV